MTVERDVCDFLVESGCIELIAGSVSTSEDATGRLHRIRTGISNILTFPYSNRFGI